MVSRPSRRRITRAQVRVASLLMAMVVPLIAASSTNRGTGDTARGEAPESAAAAAKGGDESCHGREPAVPSGAGCQPRVRTNVIGGEKSCCRATFRCSQRLSWAVDEVMIRFSLSSNACAGNSGRWGLDDSQS